MKYTSLLALFLSASGLLSASFSIEVSEGLRQDKLSLSNSARSGHPKILSKLTYKSPRIYTTRLAINMSSDRVFCTLEGAYGSMHHATLSDKDYRDHPHTTWSETKHTLRDCSTRDARVTLGLVTHPTERVSLLPCIGWQYDYMHYSIREGHIQKLYNEKHLHRPIHHLNSWQKCRFDAPFVGVGFTWKTTPRLILFGDMNLLFAVHYSGRNYWNLRKTHFHDSSNRINGFGEKATLGLAYELFSNFFLKAQYIESFIDARKGTMTYRHQQYKSKTPFHEARLWSQEIRLGLEYLF